MSLGIYYLMTLRFNYENKVNFKIKNKTIL